MKTDLSGKVQLKDSRLRYTFSSNVIVAAL